MENSKHISHEDFIRYHQDIMNAEEISSFLEHIAGCNYCSEQFAESMATNLITAPIDFKDNTLKATKRPEVQLTVKVKETSKRMQLFLYSLKVGTATIGALILLILTMNYSSHFNTIDSEKKDPIKDTTTISLTSKIRENVNQINSSILDFSNTIMKTEVIKYDQKEK